MTSGAWINMINPATGDPVMNEDGTPLKWNGKTKYRQYCIENPEFFKKLQDMLEGKVINLEGEELEEAKSLADEFDNYSDEVIDDDPIANSKKKKGKNK